MKHTFSFRETVLIVIAAVLALGIFYYEAVYVTSQNAIASYDTTDLEDELVLYQTKAANEAQMKKEISELDTSSGTGTIEVYDNLANEVNILGSILNGNAQEVQISWASPTLTDTTVRRQADISFKASSYTSARDLVTSISKVKYRNVISDVRISMDTDGSASAALTLTFFETSKGASSLEELVVMDSTK